MSYPAIAPTLLSFSPAPRRAADSVPACLPPAPPRPAPAAPTTVARHHPSQLLDWLRLAARQVFGAELAAGVDPYRACRYCVSQVRWCGEGVPARLAPPAPSLPPAQVSDARMNPAMPRTPPRGPQRTARALRLDVSELFDSWQQGITPLTPSL